MKFSALSKKHSLPGTICWDLNLYSRNIVAINQELMQENGTNRNGLPEQWKVLQLKDIGINANKSIVPNKYPKEVFELWSVPNFENREPEILTGADIGSNKCLVQENDVLLCKINPRINRVWKVGKARGLRQIASTEWIVIRSDMVYPDFLVYQLQEGKIRKKLLEEVSGVGGSLMRARPNAVKSLEIVVPPKEQQHQIVSRLEGLFSELDKSIEQLKTAQQQMKVYRQAVLQWAFEGKLGLNHDSRDLPDAHDSLRDAGKNQANEDNQEYQGSDNLPEGWKWVKIADVADSLDHKRRPINKAEREKRKGDIPYYGANGRTGWIDDYLFDEPLILVVEDETFVGRELPFSYKITGKSWVNNHAHILKPKSGVDIDFLNYQLFYYPFLQVVTGTTGRKKLTKNALMNAPVVICPIEQQIKIVNEIETRISVADKLEETISQSLQQAEALRQSILKQAFEGKLIQRL